MKFSAFALLSSIGAQLSLAANTHPAVLIHGLGSKADSWDYSTELNQAGLTTYAVDVGKVTSNWKRACDLYAQVKGTLTDYGACHSVEYGHSRYGADYTGQGFYPSWSESNPVHLIGYSMGAQTARMVEYLLREGSGCAQDTSDLFTGGHDWIFSITSLSGVLSGTTAIDILEGADLMGLIKNIIVAGGGVTDDLLDDDMAYWGIERNDGESFDDFWDRVVDSGVLDPSNEDIASYDLSVAGANAFNRIATRAYSDTYYMAFATELTNQQSVCVFSLCTYYETPDSDMTLLLQPVALAMGLNSDVSKQASDGLVNWEHQICPALNNNQRNACSSYSGGTWQIGVWKYVDIDFLDHFQINDRDTSNDNNNYAESAKRIFVNHGARLVAL